MAIETDVLEAAAGAHKAVSVPASVKQLNLLAYVHLRNIYGSTGAGRTARQIVEHLAKRDDVDMRVLADVADMARILPLCSNPG